MVSAGLCGCLGGRRAATGANVTFFACGGHLVAVREDGRALRRALGDVLFRPAQAMPLKLHVSGR